MHKIDGPGHSAGQFVAEDLLNATPGTQITDDWLNAVQAEIVNVIEGAGLTLDKNNNTQLRQAILQMVSGTDLICRYTTTANIALNGLGTRAGGDWPAALTAGDFVLVKNQTVPQANGWYVAAGGTWPRVNFLDSSIEIVPGKITKITEGVTLADSTWMLTTDAPIVLNSSALVFERKDVATGIQYLQTGIPLPSNNIGPIWHDDYNSVMTWQSFNANGANYTGYASVLVGNLLIDTQQNPRVGYIKSGTSNLSRSTYAALRAWAIHNGIMVSPGVWAQGRIAVCDNPDGTTFKVFDIRGEFPRLWDDARTVDTDRAFGTWQEDDFMAHNHTANIAIASDAGQSANFGAGTPSVVGNRTTSSVGGNETRPRNVALLASIKF